MKNNMSLNDKEKQREYNKKWRNSHPEKMPKRLEQSRQWRIDNRERYNAVKRKYNKEHPEWRKRIVRKSRQKRKLIVLTHYGGNPPKCACCGESEIRFLTIDHIEGDGNKQRKEIGKGQTIYIWLIKHNFPNGFQVLCMNCNMAKGGDKVQFCPVHHPELWKDFDE